MLVLKARAKGQDVLAAVVATGIAVARLGIEQAEAEAARIERALGWIGEVEHAQVVLEGATAKLAPQGNPVAAAVGALQRARWFFLGHELAWKKPGCDAPLGTEPGPIGGHQHAAHPQVEGVVQFEPGDEIEHSRAPGGVVVIVRVDDCAEAPDEVGLPQDVARGLAR